MGCDGFRTKKKRRKTTSLHAVSFHLVPSSISHPNPNPVHHLYNINNMKTLWKHTFGPMTSCRSRRSMSCSLVCIRGYDGYCCEHNLQHLVGTCSVDVKIANMKAALWKHSSHTFTRDGIDNRIQKSRTQGSPFTHKSPKSPQPSSSSIKSSELSFCSVLGSLY